MIAAAAVGVSAEEEIGIAVATVTIDAEVVMIVVLHLVAVIATEILIDTTIEEAVVAMTFDARDPLNTREMDIAEALREDIVEDLQLVVLGTAAAAARDLVLPLATAMIVVVMTAEIEVVVAMMTGIATTITPPLRVDATDTTTTVDVAPLTCTVEGVTNVGTAVRQRCLLCVTPK
jgi:hypothetical protein